MDIAPRTKQSPRPEKILQRWTQMSMARDPEWPSVVRGLLIKEIGAPLMGVSLLFGLAAIGSRLWSGEALMPEPAAV